MALTFGPWRPDSTGVDARDDAGRLILSEARNVYVLAGGYGPIPSLADYGTTSLPAACVGAAAVRSSTGGWEIFAGTRTKLYRLVGATWTDYTRLAGGNYSVPVDEYWSFAQYGTKLIACNLTDDVQVIDVDSGAVNFSALGGSPPKARYVAAVGDFVVLGALASNQRKVQNSGINNSASWTVGTALSDEQEFADGGRVTGISGGEFGYVVQEKGFRRMIFQPGQDVAFRFEHIEREHGAAAGYSLAATANAIYFLADDGFWSYSDATGLVPIGANKVNKWFVDNSDPGRFFSVTATIDPLAPRIIWSFYNTSSSTAFDRQLIYDWKIGEWTYVTGVTAQFFAQFATPGTTLEQLNTYGDIDTGTFPFVFDSRIWEGGRPLLSAINASGGLAFLDGTAALDALIKTCPTHLALGRRSRVTSIYPLGVFNDATLALRVGRQAHTGAAQTFTSAIAPSALTGAARMIASGRVHQFETTITQSSGTRWTHVQGLDVTAPVEGQK